MLPHQILLAIIVTITITITISSQFKVAEATLLSHLLLGPGELASRLRDEVADAEAEWEPIDKAGDSVLRRRLNITLGTNFLRYIVQTLKAMFFALLQSDLAIPLLEVVWGR